MKSVFRPRFNYSNVVATLALFVALGGAAIAAGLPPHSIGAKQLKWGAVTTKALRGGAVTSSKLADGSVRVGKLGPDAVLLGTIADGAVTSAAIGNGTVNANKLASNAVTTPKIANGAITAAKLGNEVAPLLGTLRSGQTLRGVFNLGTDSSGPGDFVNEGVSFFFPLAGTPTTVNVVAPGKTNANCSGLGSNQQTPNAGPGNLCVYVSSEEGEAGSLEIKSPLRLGFGLRGNAKGAGPYDFAGFWAVTAP